MLTPQTGLVLHKTASSELRRSQASRGEARDATDTVIQPCLMERAGTVEGEVSMPLVLRGLRVMRSNISERAAWGGGLVSSTMEHSWQNRSLDTSLGAQSRREDGGEEEEGELWCGANEDGVGEEGEEEEEEEWLTKLERMMEWRARSIEV
jgi:hypothetical protein